MIPNKKQILKYHFVETTQSNEIVRRTLEMKSERDTYNRFSNFVQDEAKSNSIDNIENILEIELSILEEDLKNAVEKSAINSIQSGIARIDLVCKSLQGITNYKSFEERLIGSSFKDIDSHGLPRDVFRKEVPAQITSLQNNIRDNKPEHLINFVKARINSLKKSDDLYQEFQHNLMVEFCKNNPNHPHTKNYLNIKSNQKFLNEALA